MPPKRSDLVHVTFHFYRSMVLLSVPVSTTISSLKSQLVPALKPFATTSTPAQFPVPIPTSPKDIQLYAEKGPVEGAEDMPVQLRPLEDGNKTLNALELTRWVKLYVSFRKPDGEFGEPEYTIPSVDDEAAEGE